MLWNLKDMKKFGVLAHDGEIGEVDDVLFDEKSWLIRYLVIGPGPGKGWRKVLVPASVLEKPEWSLDALQVDLTKTQVARSPTWPAEGAERGDPHLHSGAAVIGYGIQANDGPVGRIDDLIVDTEGWVIRYAAVDTRKFLPGKKVVLAVPWIQAIMRSDSRVLVNLTQESIKNGPELDPKIGLNRAFEKALHDHHRQPYYWSG